MEIRNAQQDAELLGPAFMVENLETSFNVAKAAASGSEMNWRRVFPAARSASIPDWVAAVLILCCAYAGQIAGIVTTTRNWHKTTSSLPIVRAMASTVWFQISLRKSAITSVGSLFSFRRSFLASLYWAERATSLGTSLLSKSKSLNHCRHSTSLSWGVPYPQVGPRELPS